MTFHTASQHAALTCGLISFLVLTGCVQTQATILDPTVRTEVPAEEVRVYRTEESIECEYAEVAIINAQGGANYTNENQNGDCGEEARGQNRRERCSSR